MSDVAGKTGLKRETFSFSGKAGEYFGIWIVNLLLTMVTFGIYSAWAKVRRMRYFYGNTWLDGHNFEYHATGQQIFLGRMLVIGFLITYQILLTLLPLLGLALAGIIFLALPWLINKAISFNARVSTYRNVQFGFAGSYGKAFMIYILLPIIIPVLACIVLALHYFATDSFAPELYFNQHIALVSGVVGIAFIAQILLIPYLSKMGAEYIGNRLSYGKAPFSTLANTGDVYKNFGLSVLISFVPFILFGLAGANMASDPQPDDVASMILFLALFFGAYLFMFLPFLFYRAGMRNIAYNGTKLDDKHQMVSEISRRKYMFIQVTNFFVIMCTFGLMRPWAAIRLQQYMVSKSAIDVDGSLNNIVASNESQGNVAASEYLEFDGIDVGF